LKVEDRLLIVCGDFWVAEVRTTTIPADGLMIAALHASS
jgi:uncharacterized membrane protein